MKLYVNKCKIFDNILNEKLEQIGNKLHKAR